MIGHPSERPGREEDGDSEADGDGSGRRPLPQVQGRGASRNPANRFDEMEVVPDQPEGADASGSGPGTRYYRDRSRSIITTNDSPDVGFEASVNPYRGCEHGCVYCIHPDTPVLRADLSTVPIGGLSVGDRIYGTVPDGPYRTFMTTPVLATWRTRKEAYRIVLSDGTELTASGDHRFLSDRGWTFVSGRDQGADRRPHLTTRNQLRGPGGGLSTGRARSSEYRRGYLTGIIRGDGLPSHSSYPRPGTVHGSQYRFRLALTDAEPLTRTRRYLRRVGIDTRRFEFSPGTAGRRPMSGIRTHARRSVARIESIVSWPGRRGDEWARGFLAGIFDAEGSYSGGILRIANSGDAIVRETHRSLRLFGFDAVVERHGDRPIRYVRLRGGLREHLDFFLLTRPAISRKKSIAGRALECGSDLGVRSVRPLGRRIPMVDITTGTGDFLADGVVSHNCYARPGHEYLGLSSGLDFETKIFVKEDAPELLRNELADPGWEPKTVVMSGVTDPYQPIEKELEITRRCLEVLAEFRNPVAMITKNHGITRDTDLLAELAGHGAAAATLSITTLDPDVRRRMEPRTSSPRRRLKAIRELAEAGVPVGVNVAPVIPGLTDHELPRILEAAAEAGARRAGYVLLRLPHAVEALSVEWLESNFPERKEKVLGRLRDLRGGDLYDSTYGRRMTGEGPFAEGIREMFRVSRRRAGLDGEHGELSTDAFRRPHTRGQMELFS
jgi:DNA repair photolyase